MDIDSNVATPAVDTAFPLFYMEPVELVFQSKAEGRPVFRDTEFVKIMLPGFKDIVCHKVRPEDIQRWPKHYQRWKDNNKTETIIGTPIAQWNGIKPSQAASCKSLNILSVEALANLPDAPLRKLGPDAYDLQKRAKDFLASANSNSRVSELEAKLEAALKEIEALKKPAGITVSPAKVEVVADKPNLITHPDGRTWAGKGRKPNWVKELEAK